MVPIDGINASALLDHFVHRVHYGRSNRYTSRTYQIPYQIGIDFLTFSLAVSAVYDLIWELSPRNSNGQMKEIRCLPHKQTRKTWKQPIRISSARPTNHSTTMRLVVLMTTGKTLKQPIEISSGRPTNNSTTMRLIVLRQLGRRMYDQLDIKSL